MTTHPHHPSCPGGELCTLDSGDTDAEIARRREWVVGTRIEGVEYGERTEIKITAIGRECVLAAEVFCDHRFSEHEWTLANRCWGEVKP